MMRMRRPTLVAVLLAVTLLGAACTSSGGGSGGSGSGAAAPAASGSQSLRGVCPDPIVVQSNWFPEAEHGGLYQLLGSSYKIDAAHKRVSGPLVAGGKDTGVRIEIRAGGPAVGFQTTAAIMYQDPKITLGMAQSDELVQYSQKQLIVGVVAPLEIDPQIIMWGRDQHPDWHVINDIGQTDTKVLYFETSTFMEYLVGSGILRRSQIDGSYQGSPDAFVASGGKIAEQAYATGEPYLYEHELPGKWNKPVAYQLIYDTGYPNYANLLAIRPDQKASLTSCMRRLVPMIQRAQVDFMSNPGHTLDLIVKVNGSYKGVAYSRANAQFAVDQMRRLGIVANGPDRTIGNFDTSRIQRLISIDAPIFAGQKKPMRANLTPADIVTNEFVDPSIGLTS